MRFVPRGSSFKQDYFKLRSFITYRMDDTTRQNVYEFLYDLPDTVQFSDLGTLIKQAEQYRKQTITDSEQHKVKALKAATYVDITMGDFL